MTLTTLRLSSTNQSVAFSDQGCGEPLILLHGVGLQSAAWGPQITALKGHYRVIALDLPGHGGSDPLPTGGQLPEFVTWLHEVVQALDISPVNVAGHSMGALIALGFAARFPELIRRVALLNGVYCRDEASRHAVQARAAEIGLGRIDLETPLERWFGDTPSEIEARKQVASWLSAVAPEGYATAYNAFAHGDTTYADQLPHIKCPFLTLTGDGDPNSTSAMSIAMAAKVQQGRAVIVRGHRHMVNLTAPSEVNTHLHAWLKQPADQGGLL